MNFTIRVANINILIQSVYSGIYKECRDYLIDDNIEPDIEIRVDDDSIRKEFEQIQLSGEPINDLQEAEILLVHRRIAESLLEFDILLMHGAVIAVNNNSYMFTGRSGTGKTTHIKKWLENIEGSFVVNGDKPFLIVNSAGVFACGTPWCGKERYGTNTIIPLRSIVFMERSTNNYIEKVSIKSIFPMLLEQTYQPSDVEKMKRKLRLLLKIKEHVSFYKFYFNNFKDDAFHTSFDLLTQ